MPISMQDLPEDLEITKLSESCRLEAYWDKYGQCWTIGWGHTGMDVHEGLVWTQEQADIALLEDRKTAAAAVNRHVDVAITQKQFSALVDFVYNEGEGHFATSTLLKLVNQRRWLEAEAEFKKWIYAGGEKLAGLVTRRENEAKIFDEGVPSAEVQG